MSYVCLIYIDLSIIADLVSSTQYFHSFIVLWDFILGPTKKCLSPNMKLFTFLEALGRSGSFTQLGPSILPTIPGE